MAKLKVEYVPLDSITPYKNNAKLHPEEQVEQIRKSIEEFGFNDPIAVWHGEIVEGHGKLMAAQELGMETVPVIRLDDLTDEQRRAYALAHNKLTMNSGFDFGVLEEELEHLNFDMSAFGFEDSHIDWERVEESGEDNYEKPESEKLRCPLCGGVDEKIRFVKV